MPLDTNQGELSPVEIFRTSSPSVYVVVAGTTRNVTAKDIEEAALGSAVAISQRHLIPNCHIFEGRPVISIKQGDKFDRARLLYAQPGTDRCYLETESLRLIPVRGVRRYNDLTVGERVYSIGAPAGLENTLGEGLVSGLREGKDIRLIQTSAPISPGSSGGGLFDGRGNLIGITTLFLQEAQNLNFAIVAEDFWK
jgi:S1-C subfamily serine protease